MDIKISDNKLRYVLSMFILSGYAYLLYGQFAERIMLVLSVLFLILYAKKIRLTMSKNMDVLTVMHFIFIFSFFVEAMLYISAVPLIYGFAMLIVFFICRNVMASNANIETYRHILKVVWLISFAVLLGSLISNPIALVNYQGLFGNSNGMGTFTATLGGTLAAVLAHQLWNGKKRKLWMWLYYIISLFFCIVSSCRSALIIFAFQIIVLLVAWIKGMELNRNKMAISVILFIFGTCVLVYLNTEFQIFEMIYEAAIVKFNRLLERGDVSNGRTDMWLYIFQESKIFGDGTLIIKDKAAHNVYFGLMNQFGKFTGISYFIVIIILCWRSVFFTLRNQQCKYNFLPMMMAANFFVSSMVENFLMTPSMILLYLCIPIKSIYVQGDQLK